MRSQLSLGSLSRPGSRAGLSIYRDYANRDRTPNLLQLRASASRPASSVDRETQRDTEKEKFSGKGVIGIQVAERRSIVSGKSPTSSRSPSPSSRPRSRSRSRSMQRPTSTDSYAARAAGVSASQKQRGGGYGSRSGSPSRRSKSPVSFVNNSSFPFPSHSGADGNKKENDNDNNFDINETRTTSANPLESSNRGLPSRSRTGTGIGNGTGTVTRTGTGQRLKTSDGSAPAIPRPLARDVHRTAVKIAQDWRETRLHEVGLGGCTVFVYVCRMYLYAVCYIPVTRCSSIFGVALYWLSTMNERRFKIWLFVLI